MRLTSDDLDVLRAMMEEAGLEAVGHDSKATFCWATGADDQAQIQALLSAKSQRRAAALCNALTLLDGTGDVDPLVRRAEPDRPGGRKPSLTLVLNPEKTA